MLSDELSKLHPNLKNNPGLLQELRDAKDTQSALDIARKAGFAISEDQIRLIQSEFTESELESV